MHVININLASRWHSWHELPISANLLNSEFVVAEPGRQYARHRAGNAADPRATIPHFWLQRRGVTRKTGVLHAFRCEPRAFLTQGHLETGGAANPRVRSGGQRSDYGDVSSMF